MKRILILILLLSVICAASFLAGCGNKNNVEGNNQLNEKALEDAKDYAKDQIDNNIENKEDAEKAKDMIDSMNANWPADKLPDGLPVYPEGEMFSMEAENNVSINITGTSEESFNTYLDALKEAGWETDEIPLQGYSGFAKDNWTLVLMFVDGNLTIMAMQEEVPE